MVIFVKMHLRLFVVVAFTILLGKPSYLLALARQIVRDDVGAPHSTQRGLLIDDHQCVHIIASKCELGVNERSESIDDSYRGQDCEPVSGCLTTRDTGKRSFGNEGEAVPNVAMFLSPTLLDVLVTEVKRVGLMGDLRSDNGLSDTTAVRRSRLTIGMSAGLAHLPLATMRDFINGFRYGQIQFDEVNLNVGLQTKYELGGETSLTMNWGYVSTSPEFHPEPKDAPSFAVLWHMDVFSVGVGLEHRLEVFSHPSIGVGVSDCLMKMRQQANFTPTPYTIEHLVGFPESHVNSFSLSAVGTVGWKLDLSDVLESSLEWRYEYVFRDLMMTAFDTNLDSGGFRVYKVNSSRFGILFGVALRL